MTESTAAPVALVIGGGSGIGEATVRRLRSTGWSVVVGGRRADRLARVAQSTGATVVTVDIRDERSVTAAIGDVAARHDRLDALVCAAGAGGGGAVTAQSTEQWERVMETNLTGPFFAIRAALPHLTLTHGAIVTVASLAGLAAPPDSAAYAASKAGLIMLTRSVAVDYGPAGVRANCVCPGWIHTEMADAAMDELAGLAQTDREGAYRLAGSAAPLRRAGTADEVSDLIAWLASPAASYVNGAVIPIDGGTSAVDPGAAAFIR